MAPEKQKNEVALAALSGCGVAAVWYAASTAFLTGTLGSVLPAGGAIAVASLLPTYILRRKAKASSATELLSMSQRLDALNKHACINIVNDQNALTEVNDSLLSLTGYSREELIGQQVRVLYDDPAKNKADEVRGFLERGKTWQGETQLRHKDGSVLFTHATIMPLFDEDGNWSGSISARTDVTQAHDLITERQTTQTLNELRDDIWIVDSETEKFSYMNRSAKGRLSMSEAEYKSKNLSDLNHDQEIEEVLQACRTLRKNGGSSTQFKASLLGVPMHVSVKFLPGGAGTGRYLILFNDISEHLEQEQQKSAFISTVSHELRSPLTSIKGAMGLLLSGSAGELPDKASALLEIAHRNADRLILIINDILDLDKISNGQMDFDIKEVDLAELVQETDTANAMFQQRFGVETVLQGVDAPVMMHTDPNRIIQVLTNLLSNAYKFSSPGSSITVSVEDDAEQVRIAVKDSGQGIPANEQHKIFDRFADMTNSDRASKGGTGLGLSICRAIVENLGGSIGFETEVGVGTTFFFTLPKVLPDMIAADNSDTKQIA
ncbi:Multi-sensor hybrid histidine kinase [Sulfitobacter noctilucicola]|uniref:histidine kinase n=1 Tax=Sulfitobacter noctilucicola TaxID=1342301 RepID=A0A7W6Q404_9RHOB|nr:ATP-binding protein [Sulfitobacter noctilucicola]KIN63751.1 Multi-sensor hybrid histidine kinase [Sulfitobacter noctilucicola]MBB4174740.1 PAS domain S-box-containing protein [Sulfitobacter noctilucicola]